MTHRDEFGQPNIQDEFTEAWAEQSRLNRERRAREDAERSRGKEAASVAAVDIIDRLFQEGNDNE